MLETASGPLYVVVVFCLGFWMVALLDKRERLGGSKRIVVTTGALGYLVTWTLYGLIE